MVDRYDVQVRVRHFLADDQQRRSRAGFHDALLRTADPLRDLEEVRGELGIEVDPVVDLGARHDERVARHHRRDREERDHAVVLPHEPARAARPR